MDESDHSFRYICDMSRDLSDAVLFIGYELTAK